MNSSLRRLSQALYDQMRSAARTRRIAPDYARYEAEKTIWSSQHPSATPCEYERAIREIARVCGV